MKDKDIKALPDKEKKAHGHWTKIDKGLKVLRTVSKGGLKTEGKKAKFDKIRKKLTLVLKYYCKAIKNLKDMNGGKDLPKYRKFVKQLTIVLLGIDPNQVPVDEDENEDVDINAIGNVDVEAFDAELDSTELEVVDDVDFDDESDEETEDEDEEGQDEEVENPSSADETPQNAPHDPAQLWKKRSAKVAADLKKAIADNHPNIKEFGAMYQEAHKLAKHETYPAALQNLDVLERAMQGGTEQPTGLALWKQRHGEVVKSIRELQTAVAKTKAELAGNIVKRLEAIRLGLQILPDTPENIQKLEAFLAHNDIDKAEQKNPWGVSVSIRQPLMSALKSMK